MQGAVNGTDSSGTFEDAADSASRIRGFRRGVSFASVIVLAMFMTLLIAPQAWARGRLIVVVGAEGEPEYGRQFGQWADRWTAAAKGVLDVDLIGLDAAAEAATRPTTTVAASTSPAPQPLSDKDRLRDALQAAAEESAGPLWLVLIGHGTADERGAKFNLRGPDVSDAEMAEWLKPLKRPVAFIDCSSASGPFLRRVSGPGRVTIVATRGNSEYQFARFGDLLSSAIVDPAADLDKDGQTSLLEAFLMASGRVDAFYKAAGRLVTEHAQLDDTGDGAGVSADAFRGVRLVRPAGANGGADGAVAHRWVLRPIETERPLSPSATAKRDEIEKAIEALRAKKTSMAEDEYYAELERLMIELAKIGP